MKKIIAVFLALFAGLGLAACGRGANDADVASQNISTAADNFEIVRRIVFLNGITDKYLLSIEGRCNINHDNSQLEVVCKTGPDAYFKHFLGLSDNVTYFVEQIQAANVSTDFYRVVFKPSVIVPDAEIR